MMPPHVSPVKRRLSPTAEASLKRCRATLMSDRLLTQKLGIGSHTLVALLDGGLATEPVAARVEAALAKWAREGAAPTSSALVAAIQALGSDASNLRDAAHEACHAIEAKVPRGKWDRDTISRYVKRMGPGRAAASEIMARAAEQIVCRRFGVETKSVEHWALISSMEAVKFREPFMRPTEAAEAIARAIKSRAAEEAADAICALTVTP